MHYIGLPTSKEVLGNVDTSMIPMQCALICNSFLYHTCGYNYFYEDFTGGHALFVMHKNAIEVLVRNSH